MIAHMDAPTEFVFLHLGTVLQLMIIHLKRAHIEKKKQSKFEENKINEKFLMYYFASR